MAEERLAPDGIITQDNLSGVIGDIQDDPDNPDANWWTCSDHGQDTVAHVSFPTPTGNPTVGVDLQEFRIYVRRSRDKSNQPRVRIDLYENGELIIELTGLLYVTSLIGQVHYTHWNANLLSNSDGSGVEIYVFGDASSGNPANRETVEVGAVEWNCEYTEVPLKTTQYLAGNDCPESPHEMDLQADKLPCPQPY
jgi:hypothetical protein